MSEALVTQEFLFFVTDFLVDELSQNGAAATETKRRVRSVAKNLTRFISKTDPTASGDPGESLADGDGPNANGDVTNGNATPSGVQPSKGKKRKGAQGDEAQGTKGKKLKNADAAPKKKKEKTGRSDYSIFITYGFNYIKEYMPEVHLPATKLLPIVQQYRRFLPPDQIMEFDANMQSIKEQTYLQYMPKKELVQQMKEKDVSMGYRSGDHPAFSDFRRFLETVGWDSTTNTIPSTPAADAQPADDATPVPAKTKKSQANGTVSKANKPTKQDATKAPAEKVQQKKAVETAKKTTKPKSTPSKVVEVVSTKVASEEDEGEEDDDGEQRETDEESGDESSEE